MNNNKCFLVKCIFVFTKISDIINTNTGTKHADMYIIYSKYIGEIFNFSEREICNNNPTNHISNKTKSIIKTLCN